MNAATVAQLILQYGLPLTQQLVAWHAENKQVVTPSDFAALLKLAEYRSTDALAEAGIAIADGKVVDKG